MSQNSDQAKAPFKLPEIKIGSVDLVLVLRLVAAALLIAVSVFVKMPLVVRTILLVLAAAVAGFDVVLQAVNAVLGRDFFATPVILVIVTVASFCIGFGIEGAVLLILYQISLMLIPYVDQRTRKSAMEILKGADEATVTKMQAVFQDSSATALDLEATVHHSASLILKIVMVLALVYAILVPFISSLSFKISIHRALMILVIATPLSAVAAMPLTALIGLSYSARNGIVFGRAKAMEDTAMANIAVFDKAGIFSEDSPRVLAVQSDMLDERTMMNFAAHAVYYSTQPMARAISSAYNQDYKLEVISDFREIPGYGVDLKIGGTPVLLATAEYLTERGVRVPQDTLEEGQAFYLAVAGRCVGRVVISAGINDGTSELAPEMESLGMKRCVLLTEDSGEEARRIADSLHFEDVFGECDTERKLKVISDLSQSNSNHVLYVYANGFEAHSAADADIRISKKAKFADAVIQPDNILALPFGVRICRRMMEVARGNAIFAIVVKAILLLLSMTGYCNIWFAFFIDTVATLATMLNAIRVTKDSVVSKIVAKKLEE